MRNNLQGCCLLALTVQAIAPCLLAGYNSHVTNSSKTARVKVLFFGRLKEIVGHAEDSIEIADGAPIEALFSRYGASHPDRTRCRPCVRGRKSPLGRRSHGDEVAFLPPMSGG